MRDDKNWGGMTCLRQLDKPVSGCWGGFHSVLLPIFLLTKEGGHSTGWRRTPYITRRQADMAPSILLRKYLGTFCQRQFWLA